MRVFEYVTAVFVASAPFMSASAQQVTSTPQEVLVSAPTASKEKGKSPNGLPYCEEIKLAKEKCALTGEQILHMVKGKTVSGPHTGYDITTFVFSEDGSLVTNGRTGGIWKVESDLLSIQNHWGANPIRYVVVYDISQDVPRYGKFPFALTARSGAWFFWK